MIKKEQILAWAPSIIMVLCFYGMNKRIYEVEGNINVRIESIIKSLMPVPDTTRRTIAPQLKAKGHGYYYFDGKTTSKSERWIDLFEYEIHTPTELQEGYITEAKGNNGADYFIWSQNEIKRGTQISCWAVTDNQKFEIGYHKKDEDKIFTQILYPLVGVKKQLSVNP